MTAYYQIDFEHRATFVFADLVEARWFFADSPELAHVETAGIFTSNPPDHDGGETCIWSEAALTMLDLLYATATGT